MNKTNLNDRGQEVLDPTPLALPVGFERPLTLEQKVRRLMRIEYERARLAGLQDVETPEDADDFDIGDDFDPTSPYEEKFMPDEAPEQPITSDKDFNPAADKVAAAENPPGANAAENAEST